MSRNKLRAAGAAAAALLLCSSCFTGIESTPKISAEKVERTAAPNAGEQAFLADIAGEKPSGWATGKQFVVTDSRIGIIFNPGAPALSPGKIIRFTGMTETTSISGEPQAELRFIDDSGAPMTYRTDLSAEAIRSRATLDIPFTVERSVIDSVKARMEGNTYYVLTPMWYDLGEQSFSGLKYIPVRIREVMPGNSVYPVKLLVDDGMDGTFLLFMSVGANTRSPRGFHKLFSFTDPRTRYPAITDQTWADIINGRVRYGMTLDECRLALGSPAKVVRRADQSTLYEVWSYENGIYLRFYDGVLKEYRR